MLRINIHSSRDHRSVFQQGLLCKFPPKVQFILRALLLELSSNTLALYFGNAQ